MHAATNEDPIIEEFGELVFQDWRGHYEQMHTHSDGITAALSETKGYLDKLQQEITKTLEKIGSREKYINNQVTQIPYYWPMRSWLVGLGR